MIVDVRVKLWVDTDDPAVAQAAADLAVWHNLALIEESTQGGEVSSVLVWVDGEGEVLVRLEQPDG